MRAKSQFVPRIGATDIRNNKATSAPVQVTVSRTLPAEPIITARREMAEAYSPGAAEFLVRIVVNADPEVRAYAVEDQPPQGWTVVGSISHDGAVDPNSGKVKFGPFMGSGDVSLTYFVRVPSHATGNAVFSGIVSANGESVPIEGQTNVQPVSLRHPADLNPGDFRIIADELTRYATYWRNQEPWEIGPNPIPLSYVTRAGFLWRNGETYRFAPDQGPAPKFWVPITNRVVLLEAASPSATRRVARVGDGLLVTVEIQPPRAVSAWAVQEGLPAGLAASTISEAGLQAGNALTWGPFYSSKPRTLSYRLPLGAHRIYGHAAFDGETFAIAGLSRTVPLPGVSLSRANRKLLLNLASPFAGQMVVESSESLGAPWTPELTLAPGTILAELESYAASKFLRVRFEE